MKRTSTSAVAALAVLAWAGLPGVPAHIREEAVPIAGQRAAGASAPARPVRTEDAHGAAGRLASWTPEHPAAQPHAALLRDLAAAAGPVDAAEAAELLAALASHAVWLAAEGTAVDVDALLDPDLVRRWAVLGLAGLSAGTAANYRSRLARVAAAAAPGRRPVLLGPSDPAQVYTAAEEDALLSWAQHQRTPAMRRDLLVLLALCLGAGLSTAEATAATGTDVSREDSTAGPVTVAVRGTRSRTVPVRARYGPLLLGLSDAAGHGLLFRPDAPGRGGRNGVSNLVARARSGGDPRLPVLSPQRMRATWLVRHLDAGVRVDALLAAAGLDSVTTLDRYLGSLRPLAADDVLAAMTEAKA